jgi:hypothetical protein
VLASDDVEGLARALRPGACRPASPDVVATPGRALGFVRALLARDPDGHAFQLVEP